ncbi:hypothetical protein WH279_19840 [Erwinia sp. MYb375]|uniref:Uncharacterized protein n=1 Tax=Enterobacter agglomerans TaxID=549 RepID=A0ACC5RUK3_ENTAG|nr:hypothetical protein [Pantoea agglomerans]MBK4728023.1 hypothetical protein [Pantoea agglomerans]
MAAFFFAFSPGLALLHLTEGNLFFAAERIKSSWNNFSVVSPGRPPEKELITINKIETDFRLRYILTG